MANPMKNIITPLGELKWVMITGQGRVNDDGSAKYQATIRLSSTVAEPLIEEIHTFWAENKPLKSKDPFSMGYKTQEDGSVEFSFKTGTTLKDGSSKRIAVADSKGKVVPNFDKKIGNGSEGRIQGKMAIYETTVNKGVTLYLECIQLKKFVEYSGGVSFDAVEDDDNDGFSADDFEAPAANNSYATQQAPASYEKPAIKKF